MSSVTLRAYRSRNAWEESQRANFISVVSEESNEAKDVNESRDAEGFAIPRPLTTEQRAERANKRIRREQGGAECEIKRSETVAIRISTPRVDQLPSGKRKFTIENDAPSTTTQKALSPATLDYCRRMKERMENFQKSRSEQEVKKVNDQWKKCINENPSAVSTNLSQNSDRQEMKQ